MTYEQLLDLSIGDMVMFKRAKWVVYSYYGREPLLKKFDSEETLHETVYVLHLLIKLNGEKS